jgi:hypothetical protein
MHSRFIENHPIRILEGGPLIFKVVLSQLSASSLSSSFSELVVSLSLERAHQVGYSSEETSSFDEEEEESRSLSLSSPNAHHFFDVTVESFASSSAYLRLFSGEVIGVAAEQNLFGYKCQDFDLYGVVRDPSDGACVTIQ